MKSVGMAAMILAAGAAWAGAQEPADVTLPAARTDGGKPLMQAIKARQTSRAFAATELPAQVLGDLLWAAAGINRPDSGRRTFPSAKNWQEIEVYVVTAQGAYLYDPKAHALRGVAKGDFRKLTGKQDFVAVAPVHLVCVADVSKMKDTTPEQQLLWTGASTGAISENAYLFCASEGLATVVRSLTDSKDLCAALKLGPEKRPTLVQTVGLPGTPPPPKPAAP